MHMATEESLVLNFLSNLGKIEGEDHIPLVPCFGYSRKGPLLHVRPDGAYSNDSG